ncbi:MAG: leucine-rich repeat protein [Clostridia bacterium]|nr:leucine-rich repeat protein [Clostridia bacterium]
MKKLVSILLAVLLCATCFAVAMVPASAYIDGTCGANVKWAYEDDTGRLIISGTGPMTDYTTNSPFANISGLKTVIVEDGVTHIGIRSFMGNSHVKSISLPSTVKTIGDFAFAACTSLNDVWLYGGLEQVGDSAFSNCGAVSEINFIGTSAQWDAITFKTGNNVFKSKERVYYSELTQIAGPGGYVGYEGNETITKSIASKGELQMVWATPADGYRFVGWYRDGELYSTEAELTLFPTENMTLTAKFEKIEPTVEPAPYCPWCGGHHDNAGLIEMVIGWFHGILAMLLGARY